MAHLGFVICVCLGIRPDLNSRSFDDPLHAARIHLLPQILDNLLKMYNKHNLKDLSSLLLNELNFVFKDLREMKNYIEQQYHALLKCRNQM